MTSESAEQQARDLLERMGIEDAQSFSSGDLVELANLIAAQNQKAAIPELTKKAISLAAEICWMHSSVAGDRICQDWSGDTAVIDTLTIEDKRMLAYQYQLWNSNLGDFDVDNLAFHDEMMVSAYVARALELFVYSLDTIPQND